MRPVGSLSRSLGERGSSPVRHHTPTLMSLALGTFLLLDSLRVWLPSVTTIFGSAGGTPPEQLGMFALGWLLFAGLVLPAARRWSPSRLAIWCALVAVAARLAVQAGTGGSWQLYASSIAVSALLGWLVATALRGIDSRSAAAGIGLGLAAATAVHTLLRAVDLTWQRGVLPWLVVLLLGGWLIVTTGRSGSGNPGSASLWFVVGPALFLAGMVTAAPTRAWAGADWSEPQWRPYVLVAGAALGASAARRGGFGGPTWLAVLVLGVTAPAAVIVRESTGLAWWVPWSQAIAAMALGATLGRAGSRTTRAAAPTRGLAALGGALALIVLIFGYFASFDMALPISNIWMLPLAVVLVAAGLFGPARTLGSAIAWRASVIGAGVLALAVAVVVEVSAPALADWTKGDYPVRIMTYNIRYGFSADGRFVPGELAEVIRAERPDIVMLQEVDRAWFLNGGHDVLDQLARRTGMRYVFGPSSDAVWGDAIMSKRPLEGVRFRRLSPADVPTRAGVLSAVVPLDSGERLGVLVTHLHEGANGVSAVQVAQVAAATQQLIDSGLPVVVAGDLNVEPGDSRLRALGSLLVDGLAAARPLPTWPSVKPTEQIDHVLVTPDLAVGEISVRRTTASDHLPVAVTITKRAR